MCDNKLRFVCYHFGTNSFIDGARLKKRESLLDLVKDSDIISYPR